MRKILFFMMLFSLLMVSCGKVLPPGKIGVILKTTGETEIVSSGTYYAMGRDRAYFLDSKTASFKEANMKILCADEINMLTDIKFIGNFNISASDESTIKSIITKIPTTKIVGGESDGSYEISFNNFYTLVVRDIVRATARTIISSYKTDMIRPNRIKIEAAIKTAVLAKIKIAQYPIQVVDIMISNIDYPKSVTAQREAIKRIQLEELKKDASAKAELAEAKRRVEVETQKAKVRVIKAKAIAAENKIIAGSLTKKYLQYLEISTLENMSKNANKDKIYIPYGTQPPASIRLGK